MTEARLWDKGLSSPYGWVGESKRPLGLPSQTPVPVVRGKVG